MVVLGRIIALAFLAVLCVAAIAPPADPGAVCVAQQMRLPNGDVEIACPTTNCTDWDPCLPIWIAFEGTYWESCECAGLVGPCAAAWSFSYPHHLRVCFETDCPVLKECKVQAVTAVWKPVCDCVYPTIE